MNFENINAFVESLNISNFSELAPFERILLDCTVPYNNHDEPHTTNHISHPRNPRVISIFLTPPLLPPHGLSNPEQLPLLHARLNCDTHPRRQHAQLRHRFQEWPCEVNARPLFDRRGPAASRALLVPFICFQRDTLLDKRTVDGFETRLVEGSADLDGAMVIGPYVRVLS